MVCSDGHRGMIGRWPIGLRWWSVTSTGSPMGFERFFKGLEALPEDKSPFKLVKKNMELLNGAFYCTSLVRLWLNAHRLGSAG